MKPEIDLHEQNKITSKKLLRFGLFLLALGLTVSLLTFFYDRLNDPLRGYTAQQKSIIIKNETKPTAEDISAYTTPQPDYPKTLSITKLEVTARIQPVGLNEFNAVAMPDNIFDAGWYKDSAKPGQEGTVIIDGHIEGITKNGLFYNRSALDINDTIAITNGNNTLFTYKIIKKKVIDQTLLSIKEVTNQLPSKKQLSLILCKKEVADNSKACENLIAYIAELAD